MTSCLADEGVLQAADVCEAGVPIERPSKKEVFHMPSKTIPLNHQDKDKQCHIKHEGQPKATKNLVQGCNTGHHKACLSLLVRSVRGEDARTMQSRSFGSFRRPARRRVSVFLPYPHPPRSSTASFPEM